ncbi:MAG: hypothetical protein FWF47_06295, partial [Clostridia bacterium]|nr:hypothetical protein [Clostridia bacterium]
FPSPSSRAWRGDPEVPYLVKVICIKSVILNGKNLDRHTVHTAREDVNDGRNVKGGSYLSH